MKVQIISDTHFEWSAHCEELFGQPLPEVSISPQADALILAGDIGHFAQVIGMFSNCRIPVFYVPGNHEYFGNDISKARLQAFSDAFAGGIILLDNDAHILDGVRFLGCTLWTDYNLHRSQFLSMAQCGAIMPCNKRITIGDMPFTPDDALIEHQHSIAFLNSCISEPFDGKTVVISHHAPHPSSVSERYMGNPINPAFVSDLRHLMYGVDLWVHGHTHDSFDYREGRCRVVANPRGRAMFDDDANQYSFENPAFVPELIVEI